LDSPLQQAARELGFPVKGGGPLLVGLLSGEVQALFGTMLLLKAPGRAGKVRLLGRHLADASS
jgi:tripartite-type tricarboxylate transporter receptor subunit TctC